MATPIDPITDPIAQGKVIIVAPTAINMCLIASDNITANLRVAQPSSTVLPSLYRRAYLAAYLPNELIHIKP